MASADLRALQQWLGQQIIGQTHLVERLIIALLADGHAAFAMMLIAFTVLVMVLMFRPQGILGERLSGNRA